MPRAASRKYRTTASLLRPVRRHRQPVHRLLSFAATLLVLCACRPSGDAAILYDVRAAGAAWVARDSAELARFMDMHALFTEFIRQTSDSTVDPFVDEQATEVAQLLLHARDGGLSAAQEGIAGNRRAGVTVFWRLSPGYAATASDTVQLIVLNSRGVDTARVGLIARLPREPRARHTRAHRRSGAEAMADPWASRTCGSYSIGLCSVVMRSWLASLHARTA